MAKTLLAAGWNGLGWLFCHMGSHFQTISELESPSNPLAKRIDNKYCRCWNCSIERSAQRRRCSVLSSCFLYLAAVFFHCFSVNYTYIYIYILYYVYVYTSYVHVMFQHDCLDVEDPWAGHISRKPPVFCAPGISSEARFVLVLNPFTAGFLGALAIWAMGSNYQLFIMDNVVQQI